MTANTPEGLDALAIATIRTLAADVVQKAKSGHPGAPMGCAPMAQTLFSRFFTADPKSNPKWLNRDRFVLSNGHGCVLQYIILHLLGFNLSMDDLKAFRQLNSKTPGHPEANHGVDGIEVTTGPLGQGIANAVGLAMAQAHLAATFNKPEYPLITNYTYCILGDGCLQEGVAAEAVSLAGHLKLGHLICLYDDNHIQIDGDTALGFTEDVVARFQSYGWHTQVIDNGDSDIAGMEKAIATARGVTDKPSLIKIRTTIGFGSANQGEEKVHGAPLGAADIEAVKRKFGFDPAVSFHVPAEVYEAYGTYANRGAVACKAWTDMKAKYDAAYPQLASELARRLAHQLPDNFIAALPKFSPSDPAIATRKCSELVITAIAASLPELVGGSADLTGSNLTRWKGAVDFQADGSAFGSYAGRYIRFGVREHAMAAICNGIHAYGTFIPFGATFFNFISYASGAVRLSALSKHQVLYIMTHDSIGLGEDGPTHQPIETLALCRATPNLYVWRPADGNETSASYLKALETKGSPSVLVLTRQNLPQLPGSELSKAVKGGYVVQEAVGATLTLVGTGSEVSLCIETAATLKSQYNVVARVVSLPCWEAFLECPRAYKETVFLRDQLVMSVEAASTFGWSALAHGSVGINTFGASAPAPQLFEKFGLTPSAVAKSAVALITRYQGRTPEFKLDTLGDLGEGGMEAMA